MQKRTCELIRCYLTYAQKNQILRARLYNEQKRVAVSAKKEEYRYLFMYIYI